MHAKQRSESGLRFFAHTVVVPDCPSQGESVRHLALKAEFAMAFRAAGWSAELEVSGQNWRADVLASDHSGNRVAIEVQLASITPEEVQDRTARHAAAGVRSLWVVATPRPLWARQFPTVLINTDDRVVSTVLITPPPKSKQPVLAGPATVRRFVERWTEGRLTAVDDLYQLWRPSSLDRHPANYFQLDGCVLDFLIGARERQLAEAARQHAEDVDRAARNALMASSLQGFADWYAPTGWTSWFGSRYRKNPEIAVGESWDPTFGIIVLIGLHRPAWVLAIAEPRAARPNTDPRVFAWTTGTDPSTDTTGFDQVLTPEFDVHSLRPVHQLKPLVGKRRRRW